MMATIALVRYFNEKKYADEFQNGLIRLSTIGKFWDIYNKNEEQKDILEGTVFTYPNDSAFLPQELVDYTNGDVKFRYVAYKYVNLSSFFHVDSDDLGTAINFPPDSMREHFGNYVVIIKDIEKFTKIVLAYAAKNVWDCICGDVNYHQFEQSTNKKCKLRTSITLCSESLPGIPDYDNNDRICAYDCFDKHRKYRTQREWRICILRGERIEDYCYIDLGDLSNIVDVVSAVNVNSALQAMLPNCHFSCLALPEPKYFGNITRVAFHRKIISIDGRTQMLFDLG